MTTEQALEIIQNTVEKTVGKERAVDAFSITLSSLIYEIQESGQSVTSETINKALVEEAELCLRCLEKDAA